MRLKSPGPATAADSVIMRSWLTRFSWFLECHRLATFAGCSHRQVSNHVETMFRNHLVRERTFHVEHCHSHPHTFRHWSRDQRVRRIDSMRPWQRAITSDWNSSSTVIHFVVSNTFEQPINAQYPSRACGDSPHSRPESPHQSSRAKPRGRRLGRSRTRPQAVQRAPRWPISSELGARCRTHVGARAHWPIGHLPRRCALRSARAEGPDRCAGPSARIRRSGPTSRSTRRRHRCSSAARP